jgi:hypothetical protein
VGKAPNTRALWRAVLDTEALGKEGTAEEIMGQCMEALGLILAGVELTERQARGMAEVARATVHAAMLRGICHERGLDFERAAREALGRRAEGARGFRERLLIAAADGIPDHSPSVN